MSILLNVAGVVFSLLFIVITIIRAAQGREKVSFFETLLAFLALMLPLLALVNNNASEQPLPLVSATPIGIAVMVIVIGFITLLIEQRKPGRKLNQRRGILGIGIGVLLVIATLVVPLVSRLTSFSPMMGAQTFGIASAASDDLANAVDTAQGRSQVQPSETPLPLMATNTSGAIAMQLSATPTRLPSATPTPTNTPYVLVSPTPGTVTNGSQLNATRTATCLAVVNNNLNLRSGAGTDYQLLLTIPSGTTLDVSGWNEASNWWFVHYQAQTGWVSGDYLTLGASCADLSVRGE